MVAKNFISSSRASKSRQRLNESRPRAVFLLGAAFCVDQRCSSVSTRRLYLCMFKWPRHEKVREHAGGGRSNLMLCRRDGYTKRGALSLGGGRSLSVPPLGAAICRNPYLHTVVHEPVLMEFGGAWVIRCPGTPRLPAADGLAPLAAQCLAAEESRASARPRK